jgi:hypothetical protein
MIKETRFFKYAMMMVPNFNDDATAGTETRKTCQTSSKEKIKK